MIEDCSYLFCYTSSSEVLNDVDETEISLFSERWFISEWEFVVEDIIAIVKQIINESDLNCKCINDVDTKKMLHY